MPLTVSDTAEPLHILQELVCGLATLATHGWKADRHLTHQLARIGSSPSGLCKSWRFMQQSAAEDSQWNLLALAFSLDKIILGMDLGKHDSLAFRSGPGADTSKKLVISVMKQGAALT